MLHVLVLGGTGWVGHHVALACHAAGHRVTIVSRGKKTDFTSNIPDTIAMAQADKTNASDMANLMASQRFDVVVDSVPTEASIDNIFAHRRHVRHYLHCSSTGGYAPLPFVPGDETMPYDHFMDGWKQKQIVDAKVLHLHNTQGFPATVIRPSYITGPGMLPLDNIGSRRADFIADILAEKTLDLPNDGQALLQPVHVRSLADMFVLAINRPEVAIGQIYNACLTRAVTLTRYLEITAAALGRQAHIRYTPLDAMQAHYYPDGPDTGLAFLAQHMCFDMTKARTQLGYRPAISTEHAIAETARWAADQRAAD